MAAQTLQTNQYLITRAFQLIGVVREGRAPTATQSANGLNILNDNLLTQMRDGWWNLGWYPQTVAQLNSATPLWDQDVADVIYILCSWLAPSYGIHDLATTRPDLARLIDDAFRHLSKRYLQRTESDLGELSRPQGGPWGGPNYL